VRVHPMYPCAQQPSLILGRCKQGLPPPPSFAGALIFWEYMIAMLAIPGWCAPPCSLAGRCCMCAARAPCSFWACAVARVRGPVPQLYSLECAVSAQPFAPPPSNPPQDDFLPVPHGPLRSVPRGRRVAAAAAAARTLISRGPLTQEPKS
jgi:hypothetical protein